MEKQTRITFKIEDYYQVFDLSEIVYLKAEGSYLNESFLRIHKSCAVNLDYVTKLYGNRVEMSTGDKLDVSLTYKNILWSMMNVVSGGKGTKEKEEFTKE